MSQTPSNVTKEQVSAYRHAPQATLVNLAKVDPELLAGLFVYLLNNLPKAFWKTSEFWVLVLGVVSMAVSVFEGYLTPGQAVMVTLGMKTAYIVARGLAKRSAAQAVTESTASALSVVPPRPSTAMFDPQPGSTVPLPILALLLAGTALGCTGCANGGLLYSATAEYRLPDGRGSVAGTVTLDPSFTRQK